MPRNNRTNKTVPAAVETAAIINPDTIQDLNIDPDIDIVDKPNIILEDIEEKYGYKPKFSYIRLYRLTPQGRVGLCNFDDLPEEQVIQDIYGGGKFELKINWRDDNGERQFESRTFLFEGSPKYPNNTPAPAQGIAPAAENKSELDTLVKFKNAGLLGGENSNIQLVITAMENNTKLLLETMKQSNNNGSLDILKTILTESFKKSIEKSDDLDTFIKYKEIFGTGGSEGGSTIEKLITGLAPVLLKGAGGSQAAALGAGGLDLKKLLTDLNTTLTNFNNRLTRIETDYYSPDNYEDSEQIEKSKNIITPAPAIESAAGIEEDQTLLNVAEQIKSMTEDQKVKTLKDFILVYGLIKTKKFCFDHSIVNTEEEFNSYYNKTGLQNPAAASTN